MTDDITVFSGSAHREFATEVCDLLGIDRSTLTRWVASGRLTPAFKAPGLRGAYFFHRADVERLAREHAA